MVTVAEAIGMPSECFQRRVISGVQMRSCPDLPSNLPRIAFSSSWADATETSQVGR